MIFVKRDIKKTQKIVRYAFSYSLFVELLHRLHQQCLSNAKPNSRTAVPKWNLKRSQCDWFFLTFLKLEITSWNDSNKSNRAFCSPIKSYQNVFVCSLQILSILTTIAYLVASNVTGLNSFIAKCIQVIAASW